MITPRNCLNCNKEFLFNASPSKLRNGGGKFCSLSCSAKYMGLGKKTRFLSGQEHPRWIKENVSYRTLHGWMRRYLGRPTRCEHCGKDGLYGGSNIQWANKSHKYLRELSDWIRLCKNCHLIYDGRPPLPYKKCMTCKRTFHCRSKEQICCSPSCSINRRWKEWKKKYPPAFSFAKK